MEFNDLYMIPRDAALCHIILHAMLYTDLYDCINGLISKADQPEVSGHF